MTLLVTAPFTPVSQWRLLRDGVEFWFRPAATHAADIAAYACYRRLAGRWVAVDSCMREFRD